MTDIRMLLSKEIDTDKKEILKETLNILDSMMKKKMKNISIKCVISRIKL